MGLDPLIDNTPKPQKIENKIGVYIEIGDNLKEVIIGLIEEASVQGIDPSFSLSKIGFNLKEIVNVSVNKKERE